MLTKINWSTFLCLLAFSLATLLYMKTGYFGKNGQMLIRRSCHNYRFLKKAQYYMLPENSIIDRMDERTLYHTYERYINQKQIICKKIIKVGPPSTDGKNICLDRFGYLEDECLVYSFGSRFDFRFEAAIWKSFKCEIHTFDPSLSSKSQLFPKGVNFHLTGLSNTDETIIPPEIFRIKSEKLGETEKYWKMRTLSTIRQSLQHSKRIINVLKIDIDGWEWTAIPQMLQSGVLNTVKQICLEVHFGYSLNYKFDNNKMVGYTFSTNTWGNVTMHNHLKILKKLHDFGFRIFMFDPDKKWALWPVRQPDKYITTMVEISLINSNIA